MSTDEAISVLDQVTAQIPLVRADQAKVLQALQTLRDATAPKPEPKITPEQLAQAGLDCIGGRHKVADLDPETAEKLGLKQE